jgi:hypothetical protein
MFAMEGADVSATKWDGTGSRPHDYSTPLDLLVLDSLESLGD